MFRCQLSPCTQAATKYCVSFLTFREPCIVIYSYNKNQQDPLTYLLTYLLTPWRTVLLEKLTGLQLVKKFPTFYGTRRFITALTSVRQLSVSWASPIQSTYPHPTSWWSILILCTHLRLGFPSDLFPSGFPTKTLYAPLSNKIHYFSNLFWYRTLHVSDIPTVHYQES